MAITQIIDTLVYPAGDGGSGSRNYTLSVPNFSITRGGGALTMEFFDALRDVDAAGGQPPNPLTTKPIREGWRQVRLAVGGVDVVPMAYGQPKGDPQAAAVGGTVTISQGEGLGGKPGLRVDWVGVPTQTGPLTLDWTLCELRCVFRVVVKYEVEGKQGGCVIA